MPASVPAQEPGKGVPQADVRAAMVYDPRTGIRVLPHHKTPGGQCAATDRGFFCTVKAGHDGWHVAYGCPPSAGSLHIWLKPNYARGLIAKPC